MSDNELDLYQGGGLSPISPAPVPDLFERTAEDSWQDHLPVPSEDRHPAQSPAAGAFRLFGEPIPGGATAHQIDAALSEMASVYYGFMGRHRHKADHIHVATDWFQKAARKAPAQEPIRHSYNLHNEQHDLIANSFANAMAAAGADQRFISDSIYWLQEVGRQLNNQPLSQAMATGQGSPTYSDPTDQLTDEQFDAVVQRNELAKAQTLDYLRGKWGSSFWANLRTVDDYFSQLPIAEQEHLNQYSTGWIAGTNSPEIILFLFNQAIGAGTLPQTGAGIAAEIAAWENVMKNEPKRWRDDLRAQARYRHLLDLRGY